MRGRPTAVAERCKLSKSAVLCSSYGCERSGVAFGVGTGARGGDIVARGALRDRRVRRECGKGPEGRRVEGGARGRPGVNAARGDMA